MTDDEIDSAIVGIRSNRNATLAARQYADHLEAVQAARRHSLERWQRIRDTPPVLPGVPIDEPEPEPPEHRISASTQHLLDKARFELEHPTGAPLRTAALRHLLACVTAQGFVSSAQLQYLRQFDRELQARR
jgi:hypothetical protein